MGGRLRCLFAAMFVPDWAFDAVIAVLVAVVPLLVAERLSGRSLGWSVGRSVGRAAGSKRELGPFAFILLIGWLVLVYGSFVEPRLLTTREYPVKLGDGGQKLRIALVSDFHLGNYKTGDWLAKVVDEVNAAKPDLVVLAGDFTANAAGLECLAPLRDLRASLGVYAVLGNYDYRVGGVDVRKKIEGYGVEVLTNESVPLPAVGGREVRLIGLDDYWFGDWDWDKAISDVPADAVKILAAHNPDFVAEAERRGVNLVLSGHTHGGQLRLPLIGPLSILPVAIGQEYDRGRFDFGPTALIITPGVGESGPRARLGVRPEVSIVEVSY